jgi:hypothetical protein
VHTNANALVHNPGQQPNQSDSNTLFFGPNVMNNLVPHKLQDIAIQNAHPLS